MTDTPDTKGEALAVDFLSHLRIVNTARYHAWVGDCQDAGILFDAAELGGEVGELLNVVKKLEREERGWRGSRADPDDFADECADVLICLDKLARRRGVDLTVATIRKFNATSEKVGLPHRLSHPPQPAMGEVERVLRFCEERAATYGAARRSALTALALDAAVSLIQALSQPPAVATPAADAEVPAGWKLVPVEPTEAMLDAALKAYSDRTAGMSDDARNRLKHALRLDWSAMLAASPKAPAVAIGAGEVESDRFVNDAAAKALYDSWSDKPGWVPWVERGNSEMQERARREVMP